MRAATKLRTAQRSEHRPGGVWLVAGVCLLGGGLGLLTFPWGAASEPGAATEPGALSNAPSTVREHRTDAKGSTPERERADVDTPEVDPAIDRVHATVASDSVPGSIEDRQFADIERETDLASLEQRLRGVSLQLENRDRSQALIEEALASEDLSADERVALEARSERMMTKLTAYNLQVAHLRDRIRTLEASR